MDTYREQRRGGKGVVGMNIKETDFVEHVFVASTHDYLLCFTQTGRMYWIKVYDIPEAKRSARGKAIVNLLQMETQQKIAAMFRVREFSETQHLVMVTEKGIVKKTRLSAYGNVRAVGIIAINIDEGDRLIGVRLTTGDDEIMLTTRNGMSIRFGEDQLRDQGRATRGVKGINLDKDDVVQSIEVVNPRATLLVITENGYGKRTSFDEYRKIRRGGKGVMTIRTSKRNGLLVGAHAVSDGDSLMLISQHGQMIRFAVNDLRIISRVTKGVRLINLGEDDKLISATLVEPEPEDEDAENSDTSVPANTETAKAEAESMPSPTDAADTSGKKEED
jgi:DNA gyrase subunit A